MFKELRFKVGRWVLAATVVLMMVGTPIVAPVYADCLTANSSCSD
jgi:hypothetical protein